MNRLTKAALLIGGLTVATVVVLEVALARVIDPHHYCGSGFSPLINCTYHWHSRSIGHSDPIFATPSSPPRSPQPTYTETMSWAVAQCPKNAIARRLLCASTAVPAEADGNDHVTGLPLPRPWVVTTAKNSRFIDAVHVETPLELAAALGFYRVALGKRGWTENGGAVVASDEAAIAFTTSDGPALLRLVHQDDRTIADLSLRKPAVTDAAILPKPGHVRLMLGNATDEEAVISIDGQTIKLVARAGQDLTDDPETGRKSPDSPDIDLPPGKYKVTLRIASGAAQNREFEVAADETWGLLVGPAAVPLPLRLY